MTLARRIQDRHPSFPSLLDDFFEGNLMDWRNWNFAGTDSTLPAVNISENDKSFHFEVAAPGMKKDDFRLEYDNGMLTISSEIKDEKEEKDGERVTRREFNYQSFRRSYRVPENMVHADKIAAKYKDGILRVEVPKKPEVVKTQSAKEIKIS